MTLASSVGICSWKTVWSKLVLALTCAPNRIPVDCRNEMMSCFGKWRVPLNAMCSTTWARPR